MEDKKMHKSETSKNNERTEQDKTAMKDVLQTLEGLDRCSHFYGIVRKAGLAQHLSGPGPFTILAPQDDSLEELPANILKYIKRDKPRLSWFVNTHIVADRVNKEDIGDMQVVRTASGELLNAQAEGPDILIDGIKIVVSDIMCSNGIIHIVGGMLWPK